LCIIPFGIIPKLSYNYSLFFILFLYPKYKTQTGWYNDDHEFGNVYDTKVKSIKLAQWYLEDPKRIELIDGSMKDPEYTKYVNDLCDFLETIVTPITVTAITEK